MSDDGDTGFFFSVTLTYPKELHDKHSQYPILPVAREIQDEEISPFATTQLQGQKRLKGEKLVCDFHTRKNYVVHYIMVSLVNPLSNCQCTDI